MKTLYDVQQLLKRFGIFVYTGHRLADLEMMQDEIRTLYDSGLIDQQELRMALLIIKSNVQKFS
ncbi:MULTISPECIES: YqgQ family protein [Fictibacillus]|uniref:YqgQ family protein n=1 Tax=Fictibacillus terranigra TaxID=3058424 RepID=A0ABT8EA03_9BACL|nr:YqgQ family protein [Fictibacillus sp. CENA-BCM004]MDN4074744.1 YqgQ family protein [Fictibacillus sp. CENA-BCM004]